jgi:hypothetical protein
MLSHSLKHVLSGAWLIALVVAAGAQEAPNRAAFANLPNAPATTDGTNASRGRPAVAPDIRALLPDPHGVSGSGSMPPGGEKQAIEH